MKKSLKFIFFGGKGGVGKTTCAAATALYLAKIKGFENHGVIIASEEKHRIRG